MENKKNKTNKKRKYILIALVLLAVLAIGLSYTRVEADSGWDNSYGGGGSSSSSSDGGDWFWVIELLFELFRLLIECGLSPSGIFVTIIVVAAIVIGLKLLGGAAKNKEDREADALMNRIKQQEAMSKYGIDNYDELMNQLYEVFVDVQKAWMNFDYDKLRELCSDELFNNYKADLEILKLKGQQNIMSEFRLYASSIEDVVNAPNGKIYKVRMSISFKDYVKDTSTDKVVYGNTITPITTAYKLEFMKKTKVVEKCPNCGADLNNKTVCEYCNSVVPNNSSNIVLIRKEKVQ